MYTEIHLSMANSKQYLSVTPNAKVDRAIAHRIAEK
jgi:hypothetical protein